MAMARIIVMVLRACAAIELVLGILFWIGQVPSLVPLHMLLGFVVVLCVWALGLLQATAAPGGWGIAAGAIIVGLVLIWLGLSQGGLLPGANHWVIQVAHLVVAILALGVGEMSAARDRRLRVATA